MARRKPMQVTIESIVEAAGMTEHYEKALEGRNPFHLRVELPAYMPLVIEVLQGGKEISVAHYYIQHGDTMADPDVVFTADTWHAIEYTQHNLGIYQRADPGKYLPGAQSFSSTWAMNLRHQGFADPNIPNFISHTLQSQEKIVEGLRKRNDGTARLVVGKQQ